MWCNEYYVMWNCNGTEEWQEKGEEMEGAGQGSRKEREREWECWALEYRFMRRRKKTFYIFFNWILINLQFKPSKCSNLTPEESIALRNLQMRDDIVVKQADKGGAVAVWDRNLYIEEAYRQLDNPMKYQKLKKPTLSANQKEISKTMKDFILADQLPPTARLLIRHQPKQPTFYLLPKIHKANNHDRPLVSACSCPTEHISEYLDVVLQPLVQSLPTDIKHSTHALNLIKDINLNQNFEPKYLFTMDVTSLCTCIPHSDGLKALQYFLNKHTTFYPPSDSPCWACPKQKHVFFQRWSVLTNEWHSNGYKNGHQPCMSLYGTLNKNCSETTANLCLRYIYDGIGASSLSHSESTVNFWTSLCLCRTSILP